MKDYKELIKRLEKDYKTKLVIRIKEDETKTKILINGLYAISNIKLEQYCDEYIIGGGKNYEIYIELIIFKNK